MRSSKAGSWDLSSSAASERQASSLQPRPQTNELSVQIPQPTAALLDACKYRGEADLLGLHYIIVLLTASHLLYALCLLTSVVCVLCVYNVV